MADERQRGEYRRDDRRDDRRGGGDDRRGGGGGRRGPGGPGGGGRRRFARRKVCQFCVDKVNFIDYKDYHMLRGFITERGKIISRRISGNCAKHQRLLSNAVKRAREIALLSFVRR